MNKKYFSIAIASAIFLSPALSFAHEGHDHSIAIDTKMKSDVSIKTRLDTNSKTKADAQISARITALNALKARIAEMKRVSESQKASLTAAVQASISEMEALKAKIAADTDDATLKADIQSVAKSYRVYMLVMPQIRIEAAADRIMVTSGLLTELSAKLKLRIDTAESSGKNTATMNADLSEMNSQIAQANTNAQAAVTLTANLKPDNGDKAVFEANQKALKEARQKIKDGMDNVKEARKRAGNIVKAFITLKIDI